MSLTSIEEARQRREANKALAESLMRIKASYAELYSAYDALKTENRQLKAQLRRLNATTR